MIPGGKQFSRRGHAAQLPGVAAGAKHSVSVPAAGKRVMNRAWRLAILSLFAVVVLGGAPFVGMQQIPPSALWRQADDTAVVVLWELRIPRVCLAFLAGASLAQSGMAFQAMFRNPLATPFTLGVASGASLGAAVYIRLGLAFSLWKISGGSIFAFGGAVLSILAVYGLTRARRGFSTATMLLAGVAMGMFFSSLILLIQYVSDFTQTFRILRWVMGGLEKGVGFDEVLSVLPFAVAGSLLVLSLTHELNLITTGEELAASRGVEVHRTKMALFFAASLMVGAVVAVCGPIGFVGLMAPHICRLLIGPDHRYLTPATLLFGGAFLILCDTLARTVMAPTELPVGIITALLGGPFFLWLLLGRRTGVTG
jgi:iron complex transport system permease protein